MRFDHILHVCPDPKFYSGAPSPRKLLLESGGIVSNEKTVSVEDEMETPIESEIEKDTILLNAYETFIAPNPIKGDGYFFHEDNLNCMRKSETYNIAPSENITLEMACFLNIKKEVHKIRFDAKVGDYIELELRTVECRNNLDLFNHYQNLRIEFLQKYNQHYPNIPWVSIFNNQKNP